MFDDSTPMVAALDTTASALSADQLDTIEMNLHGVAGGILRRKLLPVIRRKKEAVQRTLLTRKQLGASSRAGGPFSPDIEQVVKQCLTNTQFHDGPSELSEIMARLPWDHMWSTLAPLLCPVSFRTGDTMQFPNTPAEASCTYFVLHGTIVSIPISDVRQITTQQYLRRSNTYGGDRNLLDARKIASQLTGMKTIQSPFAWGVDAALQLSPHDDSALFAAPVEHTMPGIVDVLRVYNRDLQDWWFALATSSTIPCQVGGNGSGGALQPHAPKPIDKADVSNKNSFHRNRSSNFIPEARASMSAIRRRGSATGGGNIAFSAFNSDATAHSSDPSHRVSIAVSSTASSGDIAARMARASLRSLIASNRARCIGAKFPLSEALLKLSWLFQCLPVHALADVLKSVKPMSVPAGTKLAVAGESNRRWYFVRRGRCVIFPNAESTAPTAGSSTQIASSSPEAAERGSTAKSPQKRRSTFSASGVPVFLEAGCSIGELSLIFEEPRSHTIEAATMCDLWVLEQSSFSDILAGDESIRATCQRKGAVLRAKWLAAQRRSPALLEMLRACPLFKDCWSEVLYSLLLDAMEPMVLPQRTLITSAAAFADKLMIIVKGTASSQRGDVPVTFGPGSIIGGACFVRHRWPLAIATTSIVDCWALTVEKLKWIAHRLDLVQTVSHWEPENERGKYLTKMHEAYPGGRLFPAETMGLLRRSLHLFEKDLIPVMPSTPAGLRHKGERRTSFVAHFRAVSMQDLEELCVRYPDSFNMNDLLFRTSYGGPQDHLKKQFLASTNGTQDKAAMSSESQEDERQSLAMLPVPEGTKRSEAEISAIAASNARAMRRRQRKMAFERGLRRHIKQLVGEPLSHSSQSSSSNANNSDGAPDDELKKFKAHRRTHKHHGVGSGVLSHVDDGTVMNSAQLAADQIVMRRVLREQRRKERQGLSSANALMFNPAFVFNGQRAMSSGGGSFFLSQTMSSHSMAFSEDDRSGSVAGDSDGGSIAISKSALEKAAMPNGAQEWETELKAIFAAGDDVIPTLRDMNRLFKLRSKKLRQRIKAKAQPAVAIGSQSTANEISEAMAASRAKRVKEVEALFSAVDDTQLHECVHVTDPEVNIGFPSHQHLRHVIAVSASQRLPFLVGRDVCASASKLQRTAADKEELEENPAVERTKLLLQLFRSGYANRGKANSHSSPGGGAESGGDDDTATRRRTRGLSSQTGAADEGSPVTASLLQNPHHDSRATVVESFSVAASPRTSPQTITISIPDAPGRAADLDGDDGGLVTRASSLASSPLRRKSTIGPQLRKSGSDAQSGGRAQSMIYNPSQFPSKALFFEHVARELLLRLSHDPELSIDMLQQRLQSSRWTDELSADGVNNVQSEFEAFVEQIRHKQQTQHDASMRRQSSFISPASFLGRTAAHRSGSPNPSAPSTPTEASASNSRVSSPRFPTSLQNIGAADVIIIDEEPADGAARESTPSTPQSCTSPALSDLNWTEWDTYLSPSAPEEDSHVALRGSLNGSALGTSTGGRRKTLRRVQQPLGIGSFSPLTSHDSAGQLSVADSDNSETLTQLSAANGASAAAPVSTTDRGKSGPFESRLLYRDIQEFPDMTSMHINNANAIAALFSRADALRRGETRSELLDIAEQTIAATGAAPAVWIDGVGVLPVGAPPIDNPDQVEYSADVLEARKALRFAGGKGANRSAAAGRTHTAAVSEGAMHDEDYDVDGLAASPALSRAASAQFRPSAVSRRQSTGSAQGDAGAGHRRSFPDHKETNLIIKKMERMADHLSLGVTSKTAHAAGTFDAERINHSERQRLRAAVDEIRYATSNPGETTSGAAATAAAGGQSTRNRHAPRSNTSTGADAEGVGEQRFHKDQRHWVVPWYLLQDAGHDYLAEALAETVPVSHKSKAGDSDDDDADDEHDEVDGDREQVVLVGARQFGLEPRPLMKALPPLWSGLEEGDNEDADGATKIAQLLSYAAFADAGSLSHSEQHGTGLTNVLSSSALHPTSGASSGGGVGFSKARSNMKAMATNEHHDESEMTSYHPGRIQSIASFVSMPSTPIPSDAPHVRRRKLKSFLKSTLAIPSVRDLVATATVAASKCANTPSSSLLHNVHEVRKQRLCKDAARRHRRSTSFPSSAVLTQLPALPITANMAVLQLPHEVTPRFHVLETNVDANGDVTGSAKTVRKVMAWRSLQIPL